jgi:hypothetical protein
MTYSDSLSLDAVGPVLLIATQLLWCLSHSNAANGGPLFRLRSSPLFQRVT